MPTDSSSERDSALVADGAGAPALPPDHGHEDHRRHDTFDPAEACVDCGSEAGYNRCFSCNLPLCHRHYETGGGACGNHETIAGVGFCLVGEKIVVNSAILDPEHTPPLAVDEVWHFPAIDDDEGYRRDDSGDSLCDKRAPKFPASDAVVGMEVCEDCAALVKRIVERREERRREEWADAVEDGGDDE